MPRTRPNATVVPKLRKLNPKKFNNQTGKPLNQSGASPLAKPGTVPFTRFLLTAFILWVGSTVMLLAKSGTLPCKHMSCNAQVTSSTHERHACIYCHRMHACIVMEHTHA